jgi:hypothetical protein
MRCSFAGPLQAAAVVLGLGFGTVGANAATVTLTFGNQPGVFSPYTEAGYNVSANANGTGAVHLDNSNGQCPFADPACLHISGDNPGTAFIERQDGTKFDALSFLINFSGEGSTNFVTFDNGVSSINLALGTSYTQGVYAGLAKTLVTGAVAKNTDYFIDLAKLAVANGKLSTFFNNISELSIETPSGGANVRIDNVVLAAVPVPAAGLIGLGAFGGLAMKRRRHTTL